MQIETMIMMMIIMSMPTRPPMAAPITIVKLLFLANRVLSVAPEQVKSNGPIDVQLPLLAQGLESHGSISGLKIIRSCI